MRDELLQKMADVSELKNMVMSFRVSELQVLLGFAGKNKSGRKQELLQRALILVQKGCSTPVQIKIRELYRRRFPGKPGGSTSPHPLHSPQHSVGSALGKSALDIKPSMSSLNAFGSYNHHGGVTSSLLGYASYTGAPSMAPLDFSSKHTAHVAGSSSAGNHNAVPVHPDVRLKNLPFYSVRGELLKPSSLVPRGQTRFQETFFVFHLTPQQAQDIAMSRDIRPGAKWEYAVQVQMRFCLLETSCEQEDNYPPSICVRVNGKMAPLPNPIPTNKPGVEPKRPSRPVNITQLCRISPTVPNHVNISWASEFGRSYCVSVYLVKRLTSEILLQRFKQKGYRHPDHTRALIKEKLAHDPDSEIATTSLRVSLICPLGKMRMTTPCRATTCNHLQCFDAPTYIQMNEKKPTWICPVCDKAATYDNLVIDGLFTEILRKSPDSTEIQFIEDGTWQPMKVRGEESSHVIHSEPTSESPQKNDNDVIDLTCSSDEDDDVYEEKPSIADISVASDTPMSPDLSTSSPPLLQPVTTATATSNHTSSSAGETYPPPLLLNHPLSQNTAPHERTSSPPDRGPPPLTPIFLPSLDYANFDLFSLLDPDRDPEAELQDMLQRISSFASTSMTGGGSLFTASNSTDNTIAGTASTSSVSGFTDDPMNSSLFSFGHSRSGDTYLQSSDDSSDVISLD